MKTELTPQIEELIRQGKGARVIARACKITKNQAEYMIERIRSGQIGSGTVPAANEKELTAKILVLLKRRKKVSVEELADTLDIGPTKVRTALQELQDGGRTIRIIDGAAEFSSVIPPSEPTMIDVSKFKGKKMIFGVTGDNHLGSRYARMDVLNALFDIWEGQGVKTVLQCGNMIDGEKHFNKHDLIVHGMQQQVDYFCEYWPKRPGMETHFVTGDDHEGWYVQSEGIDIGKFMDMTAQRAGRTDLVYLGHMEHDLVLPGQAKSVVRLIHAGGGTAYAISYKPQSIINSYQGGEKPAVLLIGHYHKADYNYWREVHNLQVGCTEDQSPFMRKQNIQAHIGGWTVSFEVDDYGFIHGFQTQFHAFYDRSFYKTWKYHFDNPTK